MTEPAIISWLPRLLLVAACVLLASSAGRAQSAADLPLEDATAIADLRVPFGETVEQSLPAIPARAGRLIVLRFKALADAPRTAGCNYNMQMRLNGATVERRAPGGVERLIGREPGLRLDGTPGNDFAVFSGPRFMLIYAPDAATADQATTDDLGGTFMLDVSDLISGVDGNTLTVVNTRPAKPADYEGDVLLQEIEIGYFDRSLLPSPAAQVPQRGPIGASVSAGDITLRQASGGGFAISAAGGPEMLIETAIGVQPDAPSALIADDNPADGAPQVAVEPFGPNGFRVWAQWEGIRLVRELSIAEGLLCWEAETTNTDATTLAGTVRHL